MKYLAIFDDEFLSNFRRDDEDTLVLDDRAGATRAVKLKPLRHPTITREDGETLYLTQGHIDCLLRYEAEERFKRLKEDYRRAVYDEYKLRE